MAAKFLDRSAPDSPGESQIPGHFADGPETTQGFFTVLNVAGPAITENRLPGSPKGGFGIGL
jgi:hypothetical protein